MKLKPLYQTHPPPYTKKSNFCPLRQYSNSNEAILHQGYWELFQFLSHWCFFKWSNHTKRL